MTDASTESHYRVTAVVDGIDTGLWDKMTDPTQDVTINKHSPGGSKTKRLAMSGKVDYADVTLTRAWLNGRDDDLARRLLARAGAARVVASRTPLDEDRNPYGRPKTVIGRLKTVKEPDYDEDSDTVAMIALTFAVESVS